MPRACNDYEAARLQGRLWSPYDARYDGLVALWDVADRATLDIQSGAIANWTSRIGNFVLTQGTAAARPAFNATGWSGATVDGAFPCIDFDGSATNGDVLTCSGGPYGSSLHVFLCCERWTSTNTDASTGQRPLVWTGASSGGATRMILCRPPATDASQTQLGIGASGTGSSTFNQNGWTLGRKGIVGGLLAPSDAYGEVVGIGKTSSTFTDGTSDFATAFALGGGQSSAAKRSPLRVTEVVVLSAKAAPDLEDAIEGYLAWKWGVRRTLGGTHRYANRPPLLGD